VSVSCPELQVGERDRCPCLPPTNKRIATLYGSQAQQVVGGQVAGATLQNGGVVVIELEGTTHERTVPRTAACTVSQLAGGNGGTGRSPTQARGPASASLKARTIRSTSWNSSRYATTARDEQSGTARGCKAAFHSDAQPATSSAAVPSKEDPCVKGTNRSVVADVPRPCQPSTGRRRDVRRGVVSARSLLRAAR